MSDHISDVLEYNRFYIFESPIRLSCYVLLGKFTQRRLSSIAKDELALSPEEYLEKIQFDADVREVNRTRHSHRMFSKYSATTIIGDRHM